MSPRIPPLTSLRAFEAAARHMSFQAAARELNVTPAALSHQIKTLEDFTQIKLFHRYNRRVELTEEGRLLFPGMNKGFEAIIDAVRQLYETTATQSMKRRERGHQRSWPSATGCWQKPGS